MESTFPSFLKSVVNHKIKYNYMELVRHKEAKHNIYILRFQIMRLKTNQHVLQALSKY